MRRHLASRRVQPLAMLAAAAAMAGFNPSGMPACSAPVQKRFTGDPVDPEAHRERISAIKLARAAARNARRKAKQP